jgi:hypothetical protein
MDFVRGVFDFVPGRSGDGSQTTSLETPGAYVARRTRLCLRRVNFAPAETVCHAKVRIPSLDGIGPPPSPE